MDSVSRLKISINRSWGGSGQRGFDRDRDDDQNAPSLVGKTQQAVLGGMVRIVQKALYRKCPAKVSVCQVDD